MAEYPKKSLHPDNLHSIMLIPHPTSKFWLYNRLLQRHTTENRKTLPFSEGSSSRGGRILLIGELEARGANDSCERRELSDAADPSEKTPSTRGFRKSQMRIVSSCDEDTIWNSSNCRRKTRPVCSWKETFERQMTNTNRPISASPNIVAFIESLTFHVFTFQMVQWINKQRDTRFRILRIHPSSKVYQNWYMRAMWSIFGPFPLSIHKDSFFCRTYKDTIPVISSSSRADEGRTANMMDINPQAATSPSYCSLVHQLLKKYWHLMRKKNLQSLALV